MLRSDMEPDAGEGKRGNGGGRYIIDLNADTNISSKVDWGMVVGIDGRGGLLSWEVAACPSLVAAISQLDLLLFECCLLKIFPRLYFR